MLFRNERSIQCWGSIRFTWIMSSIVKNLYSFWWSVLLVFFDSGLPPRLSGSAWRVFFYSWVEDFWVQFIDIPRSWYKIIIIWWQFFVLLDAAHFVPPYVALSKNEDVVFKLETEERLHSEPGNFLQKQFFLTTIFFAKTFSTRCTTILN